MSQFVCPLLCHALKLQPVYINMIMSFAHFCVNLNDAFPRHWDQMQKVAKNSQTSVEIDL